MNDLKFAFRQLLKNPGFTAVAVLTLALGIGANTAIFSLINAALLREVPFPDSERLAVIWADNPTGKWGLSVLPPANADVAEWRERNESFANIAAFHPHTADLVDGGDPERVGAARVTAGFFETLGVTPWLGRTLARDEEAQGAPPVALISHGLWQRRFGGDPALLGQSVSINGGQCTVIGILPPDFDFPRGAEWRAFFPFAGHTEVWLPLGFRRADDGTGSSNWRSRNERGLAVIGRLKPGTRLRQAQAEMDAFAAREAKDYPEARQGWIVKLLPLREQMAEHSSQALLILFAAVGLLLLIACVNVANLMKVSGTWRTVVGVVSDVKSSSLESAVRPQVYLPHAQDPWAPMTVVMHTDGNPLALASAVRGELKALDASLPVAKMRTMAQVMSNATGARRFNMALLVFFAVAALLLTMMGIYGVVAFLVDRRSREIGIRMALGAQRRDVLRLVLQQGMKPVVFGSIAGVAGSLAASRLIAAVGIFGVAAYQVAQRTNEFGVRLALGATPGGLLRLVLWQAGRVALIGLVAGLAVSFVTNRLLAHQPFGLTPHDPLLLSTVSVLVLCVALLATLLPARRAARTNPMEALRYE